MNMAVTSAPQELASLENVSSLGEPSCDGSRYERNMKALGRHSMKQQAAKNSFKDPSKEKYSRFDTRTIVANLSEKLAKWELQAE